MTTTIKWYQSKTLWGIIVGLVGALLAHLNLPANLPVNADATQILAYAQEVAAAKGSFVGILSVILSAAGGLYAIYGRIVADTQISSKPSGSIVVPKK